MKIMVTGSEGFIGSHVVRIAKERGHDVTECDHKKKTCIHKYGIVEYDCIIHLGAYIDIGESFKDPWKYVNNNLLSLNLFKDAKRVVFASSAAVYSDYSPYGYTKLLGESLLPANSCSLRVFNPFGPGENHEPETHIVPLIAKDILDSKRTKLYHGGMQIRDFVHVEDVARAFVLAAESNYVGYVDICDKPLSVKAVADLMGAQYELIPERRDEGDTNILVSDNTMAKLKIGWVPLKNVENELKNWKDWY